jgi:hypothetical protein
MKFLAQGFTIPGANGTATDVPAPSGLPSALTGGINTTGVNVIQLVFNLLIFAAGAVAIVVLILSGIQWMRSGGDPAKVAAARARLIYAVIGIVVIALSFFIVQIVYTVLTGQSTPNPGSP